MMLAIDIGNTDTVYGMFNGNQLVSEWRTRSNPAPTESVVWQTLISLCDEVDILPTTIEGVAISSVIPNNRDIIATTITKRLRKKPFIISGEKDIGIRIRYTNPALLGADRICNAYAAMHKYGAPAIVIDFGTAITYSVVSPKKEFIGGLIAAGVQTTAHALATTTAALPEIRLQMPKKLIGTSTEECMQSGILFSIVEAVNGIVRKIKKETGKRTVVIATGGFAEMISKETSVIDYVDPSLVLDGARLLYELQQKTQKKRGKR